MNHWVPHVLVLPEDDKDRQIAVGFSVNPELDDRRIQILPIAGGWQKAVDKFNAEQVADMRRYDKRSFVLLIDFDEKEDRLNHVKSQIPEELQDRVFVLGVWSEPEKLKASMKHKGLEAIGQALAQDCVDNTQKTWGHELLKHNQAELNRLISLIKPFLFN